MAITIYTPQPTLFLDNFISAMKVGHAPMWNIVRNSEIDFFTLTDPQQQGLAWFRAVRGISYLEMFIVRPVNLNINTYVYSLYHGKMVEALLQMRDEKVTNITCTNKPHPNDVV